MFPTVKVLQIEVHAANVLINLLNIDLVQNWGGVIEQLVFMAYPVVYVVPHRFYTGVRFVGVVFGVCDGGAWFDEDWFFDVAFRE